jgi:hypothetical protein
MDLEEEFKSLKAEVEELKTKSEEKSSPWISKPSNALSLFAFVFSFGTTLFSLWKSHQAEIATNRSEVRQLIQRITRLPIENFELMNKVGKDASGQQLSSMIEQEQLLLANQAAEKINRYPDSFTSTEYFAVAGALANVNSPTFVASYLKQAMNLATTANDYIVASRSYGYLMFTKGLPEEGRIYSNAIKDSLGRGGGCCKSHWYFPTDVLIGRMQSATDPRFARVCG